MNRTSHFSPVIVVGPDADEAHTVAGWLRGAGVMAVFTARTCDEAIFMLGRSRPSLLIIDEAISEAAERRLLLHIGIGGSGPAPAVVRLAGTHPAADTRPAVERVRKPLVAHDLVMRVGAVMDRPDMLGRLDQSRDQSAQQLEAARQMQIRLLPTPADMARIQQKYAVGVDALYRAGEEIGGDLWGIWPTGKGRFALAIADFVGHGLTAALNTFRLHALLSDQTLPRGRPTGMTALLNDRLHALLPVGQYATMVYLHVDPVGRRVAWCGAGGPPPLLVCPDRTVDLESRGLPLGVRVGTTYRRRWMKLPAAGILAVFSDGLFESGARDADVPRSAMAEALAGPAYLAAEGRLTEAASTATRTLEALRDRYPSRFHSDDVVVICVAFGPAAASSRLPD